MLVLRRIAEDGIEINQVVGKGYLYIHRENNLERFKDHFKNYFKKQWVDGSTDKEMVNCYAFIREGSLVQALYKNQKTYMMTESGKTFANLTHKL